LEATKYAEANPGKVKCISSGVGSGTDIACSTILYKAGILDKIMKIPSKGMQRGAQAVGAGEGDTGLS
jgi:tripartite-type tricarboxylate transporter receptor subunit TctC